MDTIWDVVKLVLAAGLGFVGGQLSNKLERRRRDREAEENAVPAWEVTARGPNTWALTNVGSATALDVQIAVPSMGPAVSEAVILPPKEALTFDALLWRPQHRVEIQWTSFRNSDRYAMSLLLPPPL